MARLAFNISMMVVIVFQLRVVADPPRRFSSKDTGPESLVASHVDASYEDDQCHELPPDIPFRRKLEAPPRGLYELDF